MPEFFGLRLTLMAQHEEEVRKMFRFKQRCLTIVRREARNGHFLLFGRTLV